MGILTNLLISALVGVISFAGAYKFMPLSWLETQPLTFSSTITTIAGSDTLSASRTTINNNFTALNTGKFELSDWYATTSATQLVGVGTITTGTWNATALSVSKGGTGTTSPTLNYVMLGNGSSGLKVVAGLGTSGQFLTSAGASAPPTWTTSALSLTDDYAWGGTHTFASTTYMATTSAAGLIASSTVAHPLTLNGVSINTPSTQGASSTALMNDGSGNLTWNPFDWQLLVSTTTTAAMVLPATTFSARTDLRIVLETTGRSNADLISMRFNASSTGYSYKVQNDLGTSINTPYPFIYASVTSTTSPTYVVIDVTNRLNYRKMVTIQGMESPAGALAGSYNSPPQTEGFWGSGVWIGGGEQITSVSFDPNAGTFNVGMRITVYGK